MSQFYDQASLVMVPSGYKAGKVYSQKPLSTDGELTFTRNSNATRIGPDGKLEKVRTNYSLYSEDQTQWAYQNETSVTYDAAANPLNGAVTADKVIPSTLTADHYRGFTMATLNGEVTASIYVKADGYNVIDWGIYNNTAPAYLARATFDLSTQSITNTVGSISSITSIGSGWYRISVTGTLSSSGSVGLYHRVRPTVATGNYAGDGTSGALFWGCQLENGVMTDYIGATTSAAVSVGPAENVPRLNYSTTSAGASACPSLLLEPQTTALLQYSEQLDNAAWTKNNATITANATTSPDGYANADKVMASAGNAAHSVYQVYSGTTATYTHSAFFKAGEYSYAFLRAGGVTGSPYVIYNLVTQAAVSSAACTHKIEAYGSGWFRISLVPTNTSGLHATNVMFLPSSGYTLDTANVPSWNADGTSGGYVWGVNLTQTSYLQSYIPTLGASVTRLADAAYKTGISSLIGQTEGTLFVEMNINKRVDLGGSGPNGLEIKDASGSNVIMIGTVYGLSQAFRLAVRNAGSFSSLVTTTNNALGTYKLAAAYSSAGFVFYVNGVQIGTSATLPPSATFADMGLMQVFGTNNPQSELVNQALLFKTRLTNAQLAELTTL